MRWDAVATIIDDAADDDDDNANDFINDLM